MSAAEVQQGLFAPAAVARMTGISAHVLRAWERRYGAVQPQRTPGGARRYSERDVARLRLLRRVVDAGHPIGEIARLEDRELERRLSFARPEVVEADDGALPVEQVLEAVRRLETDAVERSLSLQLAVLGARRFVRDVASPLLRRIGEEWAEGRLPVAAEHAATATVRGLLGATVRREAALASGPTVVFATPAGERHELGTLMAAAWAVGAGARVVYLGPDLPAGEIAAAARGVGARAVALGVCEGASPATREEIEAVRRALPSSVKVWLGGRGAAALGALDGTEAIESLEELESHVSEQR